MGRVDRDESARQENLLSSGSFLIKALSVAMEEDELCFPQVNTSCRKTSRPHLEATVTLSVLSCITMLTVVLNLLVITSISHFRQLHTTTNFILLSLAVADFLVGCLQMPAEILLYRGCWTLGDLICTANYFLGVLTVSVSVGNMVLISVDRYIAICDPMFYSTKVTLKRVQLCICLCWIFSAVHSSWMLRDSLKQPGRYNSCYGECVIVVNYIEGAIDLVVTFFAPILVIIVLYMRVFVAAVTQARAMRSHITAVKAQRSKKITAKKSEMKAARTLGVVVVVFLVCFSPYYCLSVAAENNLVGVSTAVIQIWLMYFNSCLNPVIYAFFYSWFRKAIKHIVTFWILKPGSSEANIV
ncbi:trace amine-associated receptor 9-like [Epinephelus fuscoguttatus]|uniref:trace amine-associated receptor 9-like n=1 Tax=Epinephelus fuscoguttatus TaxID=293821 RepID=UPI0020D19514|nr:trace amine-associated receptor 9-like [Epinephelus fuscoguttatus]